VTLDLIHKKVLTQQGLSGRGPRYTDEKEQALVEEKPGTNPLTVNLTKGEEA